MKTKTFEVATASGRGRHLASSTSPEKTVCDRDIMARTGKQADAKTLGTCAQCWRIAFGQAAAA